VYFLLHFVLICYCSLLTFVLPSLAVQIITLHYKMLLLLCNLLRVIILQEELKMLKQQQADYIDHLPRFSDHEAHQTLYSTGTRVHNAEGKFISISCVLRCIIF